MSGRPVELDESLRTRVIYACIVGSRAYGLERETSDTDRRGCYAAPLERLWSLESPPPEQLENAATQECYWELGKFLRLGLKGNPNVLECLYTPLVERATPIAQEMLGMRQAFLSKRCFQTYGGYAEDQFRKMRQSLGVKEAPNWKHAMHLVRLLLAGIHVLTKGEVAVCMREHRELLLAIKDGERSWDEIVALHTALSQQLREAFETTDLPDEPDLPQVNAFYARARMQEVKA